VTVSARFVDRKDVGTRDVGDDVWREPLLQISGGGQALLLAFAAIVLGYGWFR